ncbi:hypothetical protein A2686_04565 [Candidatus Woesebacteria bacterium RIFCSPHIGHO2_01_FULL_38_10]|uniref:Glycosyl transferase family 1 domain-containing protein n=1 Tax=Candidatus Woesebacteria bacterium RIFCSPLOWO2_01_FULL_39_10b TaxID=1802517 RepID=A0A1F8B9A9_9BACT|nr:MAG: hypothetical protein A2686_04565 [Candidatus Woesebacteria bacterium RIFCSPHIGHO2_01_FULL_38_10]OGM60611.1 MAG: hypothetical protein A2892_01025 [Candidatus Woesebacteria bacterium RIFCSPLOWO2_01_FULL_39_10b]
MRVAIDSGPLQSGHAVRGVGTYTKELIEILKKESKRDRKLKIHSLDFGSENLLKYDILHYPYFNPFFVTLPWRKRPKIVVTIHDLTPLIFPKHYPPGIKGRMRFLINKFLLRWVDAIITDSETSKKDIVRFLGIEENLVQVIYLAPKSIFKKINDRKLLSSIRKKYRLPNKFVLYVGDINYNKNVSALISACKIAKTPLIICGKQALGIETKGIEISSLQGPKDWIRFILGRSHPELTHYKKLLKEFTDNPYITRLGYVSDSDLVLIYNLATLYCQPSFYEGFGLPVLEAMASGCPVIISKTNALMEIAGGAGLNFDPDDPNDIVEKIQEVTTNAGLRVQLIRRGKERAKEFSWKKTAEETMKVYIRIASRN